MGPKLRFILLLLVISWSTSESARILAVFPIFAMSHHMVIQPILRTLAEAGHELVVYSPFPLKKPQPNYKDIFLDTVKTDQGNVSEYISSLINMPYWRCLDNMLPIHDDLLKGTLGNEKIQSLLKSDENFDLVITEATVAQEFTFIFGYKFKAPTIGIQTFFTNSVVNTNMGNTLSITSIPEACFPHSNKMTFWERFVNAFSIIRGYHMYYNDHLPMVERKMRRYFPEMPPLQELSSNFSLMFINDHLTADYPQARPPNMIPVAGIHIEPEKPLPQEIKKFMDEAKHGVILLSLGTLVPDDMRPKKFFDSLVNVFRKLPQRVLWKTRKTDIEGLPDNVMVVQWMPQRDVLAHPNCVLFITHGGLASQHETIYNGVPVIGIPYFADQHRNVGFYVAKEVGVRIMPDDISEETMGNAIQTVLGDPKYRDNMRRLSWIFRDTPMSPRQAVVYWTEYVLRHRGAGHLRPVLLDLAWYQRTLLDVVALLMAAVVILTWTVYKLLKAVYMVFKDRTKLNVNSDKKIK